MPRMRNILIQGARVYGIELTDSMAEAFAVYYEILEKQNRIINLTAVTGEKDVAERHFLDSLALLRIIDFAGKSVIDIGSGAGFPGIPLKIVEPSIRLTLLDAQQKRVGFLADLCDKLELQGVRCVHARAEEAALKPDCRDSFDIAVSRAVAMMSILSELCLPFVKSGGEFVAMKSTNSDAEIREAETAFHTLGAELSKIADYTIPGTDVTHRAVIVRKLVPTPAGYPRRFAKIERKPL